MADLYHFDLPSVSVTVSRKSGIEARASSIVSTHRVAITESGWSGKYFISPGTAYNSRMFIRDATWLLEQGDWLVQTVDIRSMLDWYLSHVLSVAYSGAPSQYPAGSTPDALTANGSAIWGPGDTIGMDVPTAITRRPSLDNGYYLNIMAWWYGKRLARDADWLAWWASNSAKLELAFNSVPVVDGLVQQATTYPAAVGVFSDTVHYRGSIVITSIPAAMAARALSDNFRYAGDTWKADSYAAIGDTIQAAIEATQLASGYLPHTVGGHATTNKPSPEATALAISYGLLTGARASAASAAIVSAYTADKAAGGVGDLFTFASGQKVGVRRHRKRDDYSASAVFPEMLFWGYPNGTYEVGGYWYWRIGSFTRAMQVSNEATALEFHNANIDDCLANPLAPYERSDYGTTGANQEHLSSIITYLTTGLQVGSPFTLSGTTLTATGCAIGTRTSAQCSVASPAGTLRFSGSHSSRFSLSLDGASWSDTLAKPSGTTTFYLGVTPQSGDGALSARLGVPA